MFSMCQKLFKALCMYYLPRDHIISGVAGIQSQAVRLESDVFCLIPPPWGGSQIFFRQMENYWVWGGGDKLYCVLMSMCGGGGGSYYFSLINPCLV